MKEALEELFTQKDISFTLKEIKSKISQVSTEQLCQLLEKLELDGKIYCNNFKYYTFPSNFFIAKIKSINIKDNTMTVKINNSNNKTTLALAPDCKIGNQILVGQNTKKSYYFIKKLINQPPKNNYYEEEILKLFYPLDYGITLNEIKEYVSSNIKPQKENETPLTSKEIRKLNKEKKKLAKEKKEKEQEKKNKTFTLKKRPIHPPKPKENSKELISFLQELETEEKIYYDNNTNKYYPITKDYVITSVEISKKGLLYILINNVPHYLPVKMSEDILPYDRIILKKDKQTWKLIKILKRATSEIVCEITSKGIKAVGNDKIKVSMDKNDLKELNLSEGTRILASIPNTKNGNNYMVKYLDTIGHKDDFNAELDAIAYNNGFVTHYTTQELEQVNSIPKEVSDEEKVGRVDLTEENIFTIDGIHTKDFDDAVSIKTLENGNYELSVSIAHVYHYIKFGTPLWKRAEKNTATLYLIDSVAHMFHWIISNGICSLNPNVDRLTKTFVMEIDSKGKITNFNIINSVINSKMRMYYEDVNQILLENKIPEGYEKFLPDLLKMQELSQILTERHKNDGSLTFDSREMSFKFDEEQNITDIETVQQGPAEKMIENFMLAVGEALADYMLNLGTTFIYRNHEIPFDDKVLETTKLIKSLGYKIEKLKNADDPHVLQKIIQTLSTKEEFFILSTLLLRSMKKAYFSTENKGHYALGLKAYAQVTSPIRRFLDLLIQCILDNLEEICKPDFNMQAFKEYLSTMCEHTSKMERLAKKAEYEADKLYTVNYCASNPDQEYISFISEITPNFIVVKTKNLIEGIIYFEDLNDGNYVYNADTKWIENSKTKERLFIGSKINIILKDYSKEFRTLYFKGTTLSHQTTLSRKKD